VRSTALDVTRWRALGGVAGPVAFIAAWAILGSRTRGYSPIEDSISRLAAVDASTRGAMTAGFLAYGAGVGLYATELRAGLSGPAANAALLNVVGTVGIAATPLDSGLGGVPHAVAAGVSYASLAALPLLTSRPLAERGRTAGARASAAAGLAIGACLLVSLVDDAHTGLWQRLGLTLGDLWLIASAWSLLRAARPAAAP
jgi:hypothetical protein